MRIPASRTLLAVILVVVLVTGATAAVGASSPLHRTSVSTADHASLAGSAPPQLSDTGVAARETHIQVALQPNQDARWTVTVRYAFTDSNQTRAFETIGEEFVDGGVGPTPGLFESYARAANRTVDREMQIVDVDRTWVVLDDPATDREAVVAAGELRLTFVWTAFLERDGEALVLGDALSTADGETWLRTLQANQTLEVSTPDGYTVSDTPGASVTLRDNAVVIDGPRAFDTTDQVAVVYTPTAGGTTPWALLAGALVVSAVVIAGGLLGYRRLGRGEDEQNDAERLESGDTDATTEVSTTDESTPADGASEAGTESSADEIDLSLLSDEERVERLLETNGGRMRQAAIVDETGWSDAKVSQLLSAMADDERVEKLRLGRENLISLPAAAHGSGIDGGGNGDEGADEGASTDSDDASAGRDTGGSP
jgi:uncharacterized membrane protein